MIEERKVVQEYNIYSVYDRKADIFNAPFVQKNNAEAMRTFGDLVNDEQTKIHKHPDDYDLFHIGDWEAIEGEITGIEPTQLANANDFLRSRDNDNG